MNDASKSGAKVEPRIGAGDVQVEILSAPEIVFVTFLQSGVVIPVAPITQIIATWRMEISKFTAMLSPLLNYLYFANLNHYALI